MKSKMFHNEEKDSKHSGQGVGLLLSNPKRVVLPYGHGGTKTPHGSPNGLNMSIKHL